MILNRYLEEAAKAFNNEAFVVPSHLVAATGDQSSFGPASTEFDAELSHRPAVSSSRNNRTVSHSVIKSGTTVTPGGETITASGLSFGDGSEPLMLGVIYPGLTQTTDFDLEFVFSETFRRRA